MKKIFTFIVLFVVSLYSMAQTPFFYEWKNGYCTRRYLSDVDSITFDSNQKPFDSTTYDRLSGAWKMEVVSDYDGPLTFDVTVLTDEEGGSAYGKYCVVTGLSGYEFMTARLDYHFDASTGEGYVAFPMPYVSVEGVNFGSFVGDIHLYGITEDNKVMTGATSIKGIWNDDMSEITFEAAPKMGMVVVVDGQLYGWWDRFVVVKMVKTKMKYNTMNLALPSGNVCSDNSVAITPNEVITTSIKRAETAFIASSVNNCCLDTFEVAYKDNTKNETKDDVATVNMDKEWRTSTAGAQSQYFYEWKDGKYIQRSVSEVDSITFSLPESPEKEYKYVDLGLPSGTLWADRNVGADSPESYGDYFAWGETEPESTYNWSTYKWCRGSSDTMTKYCTNSSYGTVDYKTVLDLEDDAAYVNMGAEWRMPTFDEQKELCSQCTWTWTTQNGTKGYKVTGPNGKSIFLPAAGYRYYSSRSNAGFDACYWSASLYENNPSGAWYLCFNSSYLSTGGSYRYYGLTVRAVVSTVNEEPAPVVNKVDLGLPSGTLWADRNVGADSPESYGDYFAWGETEPKSTYNWSTYKWCKGDYDTMTKYCTKSSYGTVDNKTVLDLEDDAAYVNMGKEWRMPTHDELNELRTKCTWRWTTQNGKKGYKVTGPNGNSIFLPAAGYRYDSGLSVAGSFGNYWSASLNAGLPLNAWFLYFYSSDYGTDYLSRIYGHTVRAVAR